LLAVTPTVWGPDCLEPGADGLTIVGQLGQSLDGQIATATGHSKYINGQGGLVHLHALRAWADVVIVGVGTVVADDPELTVRLTKGEHPARVVLDPTGRVPGQAICLQPDAGHVPRRVVLTAQGVEPRAWPVGVEPLALPGSTRAPGGGAWRLDPIEIRAWLGQQGWQRVLLEGGAATLAGFLTSRCLDYLHLITSPVLLGPGVAGVRATPVPDLSAAPRFSVTPFSLGNDLLMQCAFV
jgi:riboflavin-specific deaminase-like protein